ncbi:hypothetical protein D0C36_08985 [Mucilaginibacter conchicola]|uniref:Uncharacterized protein n=1 Tax=Mucilaginibacter conchicola TaxID=2303333 RepID=A0A372P0I9_9SPHI|nr:hypothetical protein D0C36_08985 [Mucilaginibacter conchicola]
MPACNIAAATCVIFNNYHNVQKMKKIYISAIILAIVAMGEGCVKLRVADGSYKSKQVQKRF